jgi:hypothetical protein
LWSAFRFDPRSFGSANVLVRIDTHAIRLAELRRWADTVLRQHYGGYELRDCWARHIHSTAPSTSSLPPGTAH